MFPFKNFILFLAICILSNLKNTLAEDKHVQLGVAPNYFWTVNETHADWSFEGRTPKKITIQTETQTVTIDAYKTALIIVDMQNDFCEKDGWGDSIGADYKKNRAPIEPLAKFIPIAREFGIKIIWLHWGNRPDYANMYPNQLWVGKPFGNRPGYGDKNSQGSNILEKDSWGAEVVDGLKEHIQTEDVRVDKYRYSGFWDTELDSVLKNFGIKTILFSGVNTDQCVHHSLTAANYLGYNCILLRDGSASTSPDFVSDGTFWQVSNSFGFVTKTTNIMEAFENVQ